MRRYSAEVRRTHGVEVQIRVGRLLPTSMRESRCSMAYSHPYS